jgi:GT2 family glycosyltransferase
LPTVTIVVVDNASSDETVAIVKEFFHKVIVIETGVNLGYAGGNNVGLRYAQAGGYDFALIANPDCTFSKSCVPALVGALIRHPNVAAASPVIFRADRQTLWYAGADLDVRRGTSYHVTELPRPLPGSDIAITGRANGCAMLVRLSTMRALGLFDERYFLYYEEVEWCARCARSGMSIALVPEAVAFHDVGHGVADMSQSYHYYMTRNRLMFIQQHGGHILPVLPYCLYTSLRTVAFIMRRSVRQGMVQVGSIVKGYVDFARGRAGGQPVTFSWWPVRAKLTPEVMTRGGIL